MPAMFIASVMRKMMIVMCASFMIIGYALAQQPTASQQKNEAPTKPGWHEVKIRSGGLDRWVLIYIPQNLPARGAATVFLYHGPDQGMRMLFSNNSGGSKEWPALAEKERFLLVIPNGVNPVNNDTFGNNQHWNELRAAGMKRDSQADDVSFNRMAIQWIQTEYETDPKRVYLTGGSTGGMMVYRLLSELSDIVTAAAVFNANLPADVTALKAPVKPRSLMIYTGTDDNIMKSGGGEITGQNIGGQVMPADATIQWWVKANRTQASDPGSLYLPDKDPNDGCKIKIINFPAQPGGAPLTHYRGEGCGHAMPSIKHSFSANKFQQGLAGNQSKDAEGAEIAWNFMKNTR